MQNTTFRAKRLNSLLLLPDRRLQLANHFTLNFLQLQELRIMSQLLGSYLRRLVVESLLDAVDVGFAAVLLLSDRFLPFPVTNSCYDLFLGDFVLLANRDIMFMPDRRGFALLYGRVIVYDGLGGDPGYFLDVLDSICLIFGDNVTSGLLDSSPILVAQVVF